MSEVQIQNPPPAIIRWISCIAGIAAMILAPAYGVKCIVTQHVEQRPDIRNGRQTEGYEMYGPAAITCGVGIIGMGLSLGYAGAFRFSRGKAFRISRVDYIAAGLLIASIVTLTISHFLPTKTAYGADPPGEVDTSVDEAM